MKYGHNKSADGKSKQIKYNEEEIDNLKLITQDQNASNFEYLWK